jgi:hypothetical protein
MRWAWLLIGHWSGRNECCEILKAGWCKMDGEIKGAWPRKWRWRFSIHSFSFSPLSSALSLSPSLSHRTLRSSCWSQGNNLILLFLASDTYPCTKGQNNSWSNLCGVVQRCNYGGRSTRANHGQMLRELFDGLMHTWPQWIYMSQEEVP